MLILAAACCLIVAAASRAQISTVAESTKHGLQLASLQQ
jgi:hypothetical protein